MVGNSTQLLTLLHVHSLWVSSSQDGMFRVSLEEVVVEKNLKKQLHKTLNLCFCFFFNISSHILSSFYTPVFTHRLQFSLDGQKVRHPVIETRSKVFRVDGHKTLTLNIYIKKDPRRQLIWSISNLENQRKLVKKHR